MRVGQPEWRISSQPVPYNEALAVMEAHVNAMIAGEANELIWCLEHPPLYTAGSSAKVEDLLDPDRFPVFETRRGGQYTYHGPGQRVVYTMLNLNERGRDIRAFVQQLEAWVISVLDEFGVKGEIREGRIGVWVERPEKPKYPDGTTHEDKIAAIGIRVRKWISFHGLSINIEPDLSHFDGIVPCGVAKHGVTSLVDLGLPVTISDLDAVLKERFDPAVGSLIRA